MDKFEKVFTKVADNYSVSCDDLERDGENLKCADFMYDTGYINALSWVLNVMREVRND